MPEPEPSIRTAADGQPRRRLLLLRHGSVESHHGDISVTPRGLGEATEAGRSLGKDLAGRMLVLTGDTRRARETGQALADGARAVGAAVAGPAVAFALRNPDLYLGGVRVDMVSSAAALAEQVPHLSAAEAGRVAFFADFLMQADRVGWWARHPDPPGDDASAVHRRIMSFARSLADTTGPPLVVAVTHSPVLRACALAGLGYDPGEPAWLAGLEAWVGRGQPVQLSWLARAP
jgi:broad specificity phosphatase PhoE